MADTTITATDIITQFGEYYLDAGQNQNDLKMRPFEQFGTKDAFTLIPTEDTILRMSDVEVGEIVQAYQDAFTPKGSVVFAPIEIPLTQIKIDNEFNPSALQNSWLGFLTSTKVNRLEWPFIKWFIEVYLLRQVDKDLETKVIYKGSKVVPTPGTAGAAIDAMNGLKKQINAGITAGDITPINTGAFAADPVDFVTQIEDWAAEIPEIYWEENMPVNMSKGNWRKYRKGRAKKYNMNYAQTEDLSLIDGTNMHVVGRSSHSGSDKIWGTLPGNYLLGVKGFSNKNSFELEHVKRKVAIYTDWWMGIGYIMGDQIFTNDQDTA